MSTTERDLRTYSKQKQYEEISFRIPVEQYRRIERMKQELRLPSTMNVFTVALSLLDGALSEMRENPSLDLALVDQDGKIRTKFIVGK